MMTLVPNVCVSVCIIYPKRVQDVIYKRSSCLHKNRNSQKKEWSEVSGDDNGQSTRIECTVQTDAALSHHLSNWFLYLPLSNGVYKAGKDGSIYSLQKFSFF